MKSIQKYKRNHIVSIRCVSSSFYEVFNPDTNTVVPINQTGKDIIEFLTSAHTINEICTYLKELYEVDFETLKEDTSEFLKETCTVFIVECSS